MDAGALLKKDTKDEMLKKRPLTKQSSLVEQQLVAESLNDL